MTKNPPSRLFLVALAALGLISQACGANAPPRPESAPPAQAQKAVPPAEEQPYHVAPPPAYGHKVVLARAPD
jgi:hypothetical protein